MAGTDAFASEETSPPMVCPLSNDIDAVQAFRALAALPHVVFFDSAMRHNSLGRYSFVAADPVEWIEMPADGRLVLPDLKERLQRFQVATIAGLPPFQGGLAGMLGYDLGRSLERLPRPRWDEFGLPAVAMGLYDVVLAFDHQQQQGWLLSHGLPEPVGSARRTRAAQRAQQFLTLLQATPGKPYATTGKTITPQDLAPQFPGFDGTSVTSNFSRPSYLQAVSQAREYIHAGDIFQVNLSQRLLHPAVDDALALYLRLRQRNPAPFAGYFDLGEFQLASASPERFLCVRERRVETRPIKGTRPRLVAPEADLYAGDELLSNPKDRAENIMIVDLMRNDLSRVCQPDSIQVTQLCGLEAYAYVQHLVSVVQGQLADPHSGTELWSATFPGGSITGAPKIRAMQIIAELEPTARGAYCGSLAYLGLDGAMDSSILIRTLTAGGGWWQFPVGGGIVADSDPQSEYEETRHKASGLLRALLS